MRHTGHMTAAAWEKELTALWDTLGNVNDRAFLVQMDRVTADLPSAVRLFERGAARIPPDTRNRPPRCTGKLWPLGWWASAAAGP